MNQEKVNKLVEWLKENRNSSVEQLRQLALKNGFSEEDFNEALNRFNAPPTTLEYKGIGRRFLAFLVDGVILSILLELFLKVFPGSASGSCDSFFYLRFSLTLNGEETIYNLCGFPALSYLLLVVLYPLVLEWKLGGTVGKLITGIRVVKTNGEPIDFKASLIRNFMRPVDFLPFFYLVGAISIWSSETKQRLGDRLANTVVVSKKSVGQLSD